MKRFSSILAAALILALPLCEAAAAAKACDSCCPERSTPASSCCRSAAAPTAAVRPSLPNFAVLPDKPLAFAALEPAKSVAAALTPFVASRSVSVHRARPPPAA